MRNFGGTRRSIIVFFKKAYCSVNYHKLALNKFKSIGKENWQTFQTSKGGEPWGLSAPPKGGEPWGLSFPHVSKGSRPRLSFNANSVGVALITSSPEVKLFLVIRSALHNSMCLVCIFLKVKNDHRSKWIILIYFTSFVYFCCPSIYPTFCSIYIRLRSIKFKVR